MYLQLAENGDNYTPIETNQGTIYVRNDLAEETMLAAGGKGLKIAAKVVGAAGKFVPLPGAAAISGIASNILNKAGDAKAGGGSAIQAGAAAVPAGIGAKIKAAVGKLKAKGAAPAVVALPDAIASRTQAEETMQAPKESFLKRYRTPLLIGGGVLLLGTTAYLLTRKKRR
jgi:hypothetical protein